MKRLGSTDSLGALMSICRASEEHSPRNNSTSAPTIYSREFQSMLDGLDDEGCIEETGHVGSEKKRRLSVDQVKALEKNFEVENKLEPERKVKLAQELGLQPRQVAVWFQNRRARWKTKQLERDYGVLKSNYDSLKLNYDTLQRDNEALLNEIKELKSKLNEETNSEDHSNLSLKEDPTIASEPDNATANTPTIMEDEKPALIIPLPPQLPDLSKEPNLSSDSDSSAILNEENTITSGSSPNYNANSNAAISSSPTAHHHLLIYQHQFVKMEEHNFFSGDEACNFFSDEQPPTLQWYCPEQWN